MKIKFLLLGTSLSFIPLAVNAQCVATQDCATLGYTETTCNGGKGVKCPFGNKWACLGANEEECMKIACEKLDFKYSCTGIGYAGGAGFACGGKYAYCMCAERYEWKDGVCQQQALNGVQGDLYYCNGAVVAVKAPGMNFYVAMTDLAIMGWSSARSSCQNYPFCGNLKGTLPSKDQLVTMYNNKSLLNSLLSTNGGTSLSNGYYWSSTYYGDYTGSDRYHIVNMSDGNVTNILYHVGSNYVYVRPVLVTY